MPVPISDRNEPQQSDVGDVPLLVLPVIKLKHGVKLVIIEVVHGVLICPFTRIEEKTRRVADTAASWENLTASMRPNWKGIDCK